MKTLNRKDTRTLGYFAFGTAVMCLIVQACSQGVSQGVSGWLSLSLASYSMLAIVLIASANDPDFQKQNPWLLRLTFAGMAVPAIGITLSRWFSAGCSVWISVAAVAPLSVAIALSIWYRHNHGIKAEVNSQ
jgi:hypothetical protein